MLPLIASALLIPQVLSPALSTGQANALLRLRDLPRQGGDLREGERQYAQLTREAVLGDLITLYSPENERRLKITYAAFAPDSLPGGGPDMGLGLSVVKRLELENGRVIEVNELWAEDRATGGLYLPDEIRMKSLTFPGPRHVPGAEGRYLFDALRLAWGNTGEASFYRRGLYGDYDSRTHRNRILPRRVPVSSPFSCHGCHQSGRHFADRFLKEGEPRDYDSIVQPSYYNVPVTETLGFREYLTHLKEKPGVTPELIRSVQKTLLNPLAATRIPGFPEALKAYRRARSVSWLGEDGGVSDYDLGRDPLLIYRQGIYGANEGGYYGMDAIEDADENEGKYRYWFPTDVIPADSGHAY